MYAYALVVKGRYPPSHPWSTIALVLFAVFQLRYAAVGKVGVSVLTWMAAVLMTISAVFWTVAAILD